MHKYMAVHTMPKPTTVEEVTPLVLKLLANEKGEEAYWVGAWAQTDDKGNAVKIYCEWNAKDEKTIRDVFEGVPDFPLDSIHPMMKMDSMEFRQQVSLIEK